MDAYIIRGLPGSGKSTLAKKLCKEVVCADDYFMKNGRYCYDYGKIDQAHDWCFDAFSNLIRKHRDVAVANTFVRRWEWIKYFDFAKQEGCRVTVVSLFDNMCTDEELFRRNKHNVPLESIQRMRPRWQW